MKQVSPDGWNCCPRLLSNLEVWTNCGVNLQPLQLLVSFHEFFGLLRDSLVLTSLDPQVLGCSNTMSIPFRCFVVLAKWRRMSGLLVQFRPGACKTHHLIRYFIANFGKFHISLEALKKSVESVIVRFSEANFCLMVPSLRFRLTRFTCAGARPFK